MAAPLDPVIAQIIPLLPQGAGLIHGYFGLGDASDVARAEAQRARADFKASLARGV